MMLRSLVILGALAVAGGAAADSVVSERTTWTNLPVKADPAVKDPLVQRGKAVFQARCAACHGPPPRPGLPAMAGTQALQARYQGSKPAMLEERTDLTPELVKVFVRHGAGLMPFFRPTELTDEDVAAVGAYIARKDR